MNAGAMIAVLMMLPIDDPPETDMEMFPDRDVAIVNWRHAADHLFWMQQQPKCLYCDYDEWVRDAEYCRKAWDTLDNIRRGFGNRRCNLAILRNHLGYKAYYSGWMPPPVPFWRMRAD
jgi:hypothetical protein